VVTARTAVLSVITGGGKWVEITTHADPLYQHREQSDPSLFIVAPPCNEDF